MVILEQSTTILLRVLVVVDLVEVILLEEGTDSVADMVLGVVMVAVVEEDTDET